MKLTFRGAAGTVTGSRILFDHHHFKGLVDCGLFQGPRDFRQLNWLDQPDLNQAQCVLLTHAHIDHSGYLPRLYKNGFRGPIYCSAPTSDLLPIMLLDAAKLQEEDAYFANKIRHSRHDPALPLYQEVDALGCNRLIHATPWNEWTPLSESLSFRLSRSGHILGSAYIQLAATNSNSSKIVTFSGDLGSPSPPILREAEAIQNTDVLVVESTYGNRALPRTNVSENLALVINKVIGRGGTLIIPAFSVGRTQDLLYLISQLKKKQHIKSCPVYLDSPMAHRVTEVYLKNLPELKEDFTGNDIEEALGKAVFKPTLSPDDSMLLCMSDEPKIVISASGMLQGGRVLHHLKMKLPHEKNGVLFVGYQGMGTKGRLLKDGLTKIRLHHTDVDVEAEIFSIDGLSAHADSNEIIAWLQRFQQEPELTLINHGEPEASQALAYRITHELGWKNVRRPELNETFDLS
ncbi:MAG: MBL fold metallo-hydrolase [Bdellovibrio sp. CG10_big_fil_rev_8_21_14_0_10_47_8]|nr:MAG: MBL fold metallo-hydrolase [Bdellovibrio sp. CG10_big_fil_rev_8_21_14_0_10_47_8]